ncbi:flavin reductase [Limoniibacter endophyticus]|nr:flavin reductase [Limoniibacter endophyticus]
MDHRFDIVDSKAFRSGMSRLGAAVNIITTQGVDGPHGFTASAVCSVSDSPATLLACINRSASCFPAFEAARYFCVNTLAPHHEPIADLFGGKTPMAERFLAGGWEAGKSGVPVLDDALVSFECCLSHFIDQETHRVLFGSIIGIRATTENSALLYQDRRYVRI